MTALILTYSGDNDSIPSVMQTIEERGGKAFRFDSDRFPSEIQLDVYYSRGSERLVLVSDRGSLDLEDVSSVWYRRFRTGEKLPVEMDAQWAETCKQESQRTLVGAILNLNCFHLDPILNVYRAEHKLVQLRVARELGLETPRTLITNRPAAVRAFAGECEQGLIVKMQTPSTIREAGKDMGMFTNLITEEDLQHLEGLSLCPMTFQENVPKALELRVTVVGNQVFAASVDSQQLERSQYDWRRQVLTLANAWSPYALPDAIADKLLNLTHAFGLNYGAIDLILTPDDRYVFLEINPCGEFFWLDCFAGLPITRAIGHLLLDSSERDRIGSVKQCTPSIPAW